MTGVRGCVNRTTCPHGDKPGVCLICALASLRRNMPAVQRAVTGGRDKTAGGGFVRGGAPSWEPISLAAYALLQDVRSAGGLNRVEAMLNTLRDPAALIPLQRLVRQLASRAQLILGQATAPYRLLWESEPYLTVYRNRFGWQARSVFVPCPVVSDRGDCGAPLWVHRDNDPLSEDFTKAKTICCARTDDHEWTGGREWLRLGVLLGGIG